MMEYIIDYDAFLFHIWDEYSYIILILFIIIELFSIIQMERYAIKDEDDIFKQDFFKKEEQKED